MKKSIFKVLNKITQTILPKFSGKDPMKLSKFQKVLLGIKYYVLINSLD
ncbi:hypothetical protein [Chryseobacterium sp. T1]